MALVVEADGELCCGYGNCVMLCPDVFALPDGADTVTIVSPTVPVASEEAAREAVRDCPTGALRLLG
jgi:ferredoxin